MSNNNIRLIFLVVCFALTGLVNAQEDVDPVMLQRVEADYQAMKDMTSEQRQAFREQNRAAMTRDEQRAYQRAFKALRPNLPAILGVTGNNAQSTVEADVTRVPGTNITYDTGVRTGNSAGVASQMLGNLFNTGQNAAGTATENVETTGTLTQITFDMQNTFFSSAVWSLYSNIMGTTNNQVTSMGRSVATGFNTLTVDAGMGTSVQYQNGAFAAGIWQFNPSSTGLAVDSNSVGGQGFHAISQNDGAMGSMFTTVTAGGMGLNAIFRVSGNVLQETVPVELMDFTIEED